MERLTHDNGQKWKEPVDLKQRIHYTLGRVEVRIRQIWVQTGLGSLNFIKQHDPVEIDVIRFAFYTSFWMVPEKSLEIREIP